MSLNKREKTLLLMLAFVVFVGVYFKFLLTPLQAKIADLQAEEQVYQEKHLEMLQLFGTEPSLDEQLLSVQNQIKNITSTMFGTLDQEDIIVFFYDLLAKGNVELSALNFTEPRVQVKVNEAAEGQGQSGSGSATIYSMQFHYQAEYEELMNFLRAIREYEKRVAINNLEVSAIQDGVMTGNIAFDVYSVPYVDQLYPDQKGILASDVLLMTDIKLENPFIFYTVEEPEESSGSGSWEIIEELEEVIVENWTTLYGFDDQLFFFVGNPRDITGSATLDALAIEGQHAARIQYDFLRERAYSVANLVFDDGTATIPKQPLFIELSVYSEETNRHKVGLVLIDAGGREYNIPLANEVNQIGWQKLKATVPVDITYPAIVQRIYLENDDVKGKLNGNLLFDNLQVLYPDLSPMTDEISGQN